MLLSSFSTNKCVIIKDNCFDNLRKISDHIEGLPLTFLDDRKFLKLFMEKKDGFSCVITSPELFPEIKGFHGGVAISDYPKADFIRINNEIPVDESERRETIIAENAVISRNTSISEYGVIIGERTIIEDYVTIYSGVEIESDVVVRRGTILGCSEYERCRDENNYFITAIHKGKLKVLCGAQIDEYVLIDRPLFHWDYTCVGENAFIGKMSHIGHGTKIGAHVLLSPRSTICGNTVIEDNVKIGPGAIVGSRIIIGHDSVISIGSVVNKNVLPNERVSGNLAIPHDLFIHHLKGMMNKQ